MELQRIKYYIFAVLKARLSVVGMVMEKLGIAVLWTVLYVIIKSIYFERKTALSSAQEGLRVTPRISLPMRPEFSVRTPGETAVGALLQGQ